MPIIPIIPMPIFIPDDGNEELLIPDAVGVILYGERREPGK